AARRTALAAQFDLSDAAETVALLPGAEYGPAKRWPARHFGALAQRLVAAGITPLVLGSARERDLGDEIARLGGSAVVNLCGATELVDVVDLLSGCRAAVSNDSGLMHVACAVGIAVVALYGSSSPDFTPPLSDRARIVRLGIACSPCFQRHCPLGHTHCLTRMDVNQVWQALAPDLAPVVK
ncbi:MAG: lipopolysaccharide heptosyltransferase II, partial [Salinisphaera sp.]|nr:lipopolysaccharide heptosyltransferase II [Salinisphaera sp.]